MSYFLAFLGFVILVILHEAGHFTVAKAVGMRVERFSLFFPPLLVRRQVGETEYAIGALPLGGYVKISGMNPSEDLPDEVRTRAYYAQPPWKQSLALPNALDNINGFIRFDSRGIQLDELNASLGGGPVQFFGRVGLEGYLPGELNVLVRGRQPPGSPPLTISVERQGQHSKPRGRKQSTGGDAGHVCDDGFELGRFFCANNSFRLS